ncbi:uncharacterized protein TNCV_4161021 [Trichonephila clavipes]|nr:uncharacterized protein TNCV_4161021 [Trichonephila clavipes]
MCSRPPPKGYDAPRGRTPQCEKRWFKGKKSTQNSKKVASENAMAEAHFWLNGYVSKQNCRIWSEANPQVYVETPLHPEKLTVWCALWAGGILLQKR